MGLEIRHLQLVVAVAEAGSISGGAARLALPQPAVSSQLRRIERILGTALFERSVNGVVPTEAGNRLLHHARAVIAAMTTLIDDVNPDSASRPFTIACYSPGVGPLLSQLHHLMPGAQWRTDVFDYHLSPQRVRRGLLDVAIGYSLSRDPVLPLSGVAWSSLAREPIYLAVGPTHSLAGVPSVHLRDVHHEVWVARAGGPLRDMLVDACAAAGFVPDIRYNVVDNNAVRTIVAAGHAVALAAPLRRRDGIRLIPLLDGPCRDVYLAHHPRLLSLVDEAKLVEAARRWRRDLCFWPDNDDVTSPGRPAGGEGRAPQGPAERE